MIQFTTLLKGRGTDFWMGLSSLTFHSHSVRNLEKLDSAKLGNDGLVLELS